MSGRQLFIVGEGMVSLTLNKEESSATSSRVSHQGTASTRSSKGGLRVSAGRSNGVASESTQNLLKSARAFRHGRMLPRGNSNGVKYQGLIDLGLEMHKDTADPNNDPAADSNLPAGYTYLGQFITHDITFDKTVNIADGELDAKQIRQGRTPSLELDSLYGMGPLSASSRHLYENDCLHFKIGKTTPTLVGNAQVEYPNDLPRDTSNPANPRKALIAEPRNDRNLALAQTHLAFLKFHNAVVNHLADDGLLGRELFEAARKKVIQHYQCIVLEDYLPRILDDSVLTSVRKDVLANGAKRITNSKESGLFLPVEFSFAAFRFGHSLVRDKYEWNRVFETPAPNAPNNGVHRMDGARLHQLFTLTGANGNLGGAKTLPTNWAIDWTRFYDFSEFRGIRNNPKSNRARKINTTLSIGLKGMPGFPADIPIESRSVAVLDLQMGAMLSLPTGQEAAIKFKLDPLEEEQIAEGPHQKILEEYGFHQKTPLWYYIMKEAEIENNGERLGQVGSRIVAETIFGLIKSSEYSILKDPNWKPDLGRDKDNIFGMADLLVFTKKYGYDDNDPINPLE